MEIENMSRNVLDLGSYPDKDGKRVPVVLGSADDRGVDGAVAPAASVPDAIWKQARAMPAVKGLVDDGTIREFGAPR